MRNNQCVHGTWHDSSGKHITHWDLMISNLSVWYCASSAFAPCPSCCCSLSPMNFWNILFLVISRATCHVVQGVHQGQKLPAGVISTSYFFELNESSHVNYMTKYTHSLFNVQAISILFDIYGYLILMDITYIDMPD